MKAPSFSRPFAQAITEALDRETVRSFRNEKPVSTAACAETLSAIRRLHTDSYLFGQEDYGEYYQPAFNASVAALKTVVQTKLVPALLGLGDEQDAATLVATMNGFLAGLDDTARLINGARQEASREAEAALTTLARAVRSDA